VPYFPGLAPACFCFAVLTSESNQGDDGVSLPLSSCPLPALELRNLSQPFLLCLCHPFSSHSAPFLRCCLVPPLAAAPAHPRGGEQGQRQPHRHLHPLLPGADAAPPRARPRRVHLQAHLRDPARELLLLVTLSPLLCHYLALRHCVTICRSSLTFETLLVSSYCSLTLCHYLGTVSLFADRARLQGPTYE